MEASSMDVVHPGSVVMAGTPIECPVLLDVLRSLRGERFVYFPNPGNAGDSAINHATFRLFEREGLRYDVAASTRMVAPEGSTVVYGGGGSLVPLYEAARRVIEAHHAGARRLVLLPHTVRGHEDLLARLGPNVTLVTRDRPSFDHARTHAPQARVLLSHDMALSMDVRAVLAAGRARWLPVVSGPGFLVRNAKRMVRRVQHAVATRGDTCVLQAFRTDDEASGAARPSANIDVSLAFSGDRMSPDHCFETTYRTLAFLDRFDRVCTDRLHVGILSALLGKEVTFADNSYGKNRSVYEHSLRQRFGNVTYRAASIR